MDESIRMKCEETAELFGMATGLEAKVIDYSGQTLKCFQERTCDSCVCEHISDTLCRQSHRFGAYQSQKFDGSYIFFCPIGLVHFVSPIVIKNKLVGGLLCGHFLMTEPDVFLIRHIQKYVTDARIMKEFVQNVLVLPPGKVRALAEILKKLALQIGDGSPVENDEQEQFDLTEAKHYHALHKVTNYIQENYMQKISLENVAEQVHFTPQYLSKIFKEETGGTFKQYLSMMRIEKSKRLLKDSENSLSEVAYLTGFSDQSHFSKTFKKQVGISPSTYQLSHIAY